MTSPLKPMTITSDDLRINSYLRTKYDHLDLSEKIPSAFIYDELMFDDDEKRPSIQALYSPVTGSRNKIMFVDFFLFCQTVCYWLKK